jgi:phage terminase large subunit
MTAAELKPEHRPYRPHGASEKLLYAHDSELLISGPAGTGKSRGCLEKLHICAEKYPNMRALIVRKTRESLTESALVTFEEKVMPVGHEALQTGGQRRMRQAYTYKNGSAIVVGGLDKSSRIMSTEFDLIFVQEAIELEEEAWEALTTRLRNGALPYAQIIGDTNPDRPTHWLKRRCDVGKTVLLESRHEDNPVLWDGTSWTPAGFTYLSKLDNLTGPRKQRLRFGKWVQAEGVVYPDWDAAVHVIDRFEIPRDWPRYWAIDFGFTNPLVCLWGATDPDGRLYVYREYYQSQTLVEDAAKEIKALSADEPAPRAIICDHDAEDRATMVKHLDIDCDRAVKDVSPGIQAVAARLRKAGDGKPRLFVLRDSLVRRDPMMVEAKKPTCLVEEVDGYIWDTSANRKQGEEPLKRDDHALDALRYLCAELDGPQIDWNIRVLDLRLDAGLPSSLRRPAPLPSWPRDEEPLVEGIRFHGQCGGWQSVVTIDNQKYYGPVAFKQKEFAMYFTARFYERMGTAPPYAAPPLDAETAEEIEKKVTEFITQRRRVPAH